MHGGIPWDGGELGAWSDRVDGVEGGAEQGSEWVASVGAGRVVIGMPEAAQVELWEGLGASAGASAGLVLGTEGFGAAVAWSSGDLWVGQPELGLDAGALSRFEGASGAATTRILGEDGERLGATVRTCGDLDGDGVDDLVVGVPGFGGVTPAGTLAPRLAGAIGVVSGAGPPAGDIGIGAGSWIWGDESGAGLGAAFVCDVDIDGDGRVDLLVGLPWAGPDDVGAIVQVSPGPGPLSERTLRRMDGRVIDGWFGRSLAAADVDGDAVPDLLVGVPGASGGEGAVQWFSGAPWLVDEPLGRVVRTVRLPGARHAGRELAVGDLDGDGRPEVLVGAPDTVIDGDTDRGLAGLWSASAFSSGGPPDARIVGETPFARVGARPVLADLDGDGRAEVLLPLRAPAP